MLCVDNLSQSVRLIDRCRIADNFWTRFRGLTFVRQLEAGEGLLITTTNSIHTHFMFMSIDVLYVNKQNVIVDIVHSMKPWRMAMPRAKANYVIEMPAGAVARTGCKVGDQLRLFPDA